MRIALVQQTAGPDRDANLERRLTAIDRAAVAGADLVAFAELTRERFFPQRRGCGDLAAELAEPIPGRTTERLAERARDNGVVVVFNMYEEEANPRSEADRTDPEAAEADPEGAGTSAEAAGAVRRFDASPVIDADGSLLGVTRMVHVAQFEGFWEQEYYDWGDRGAPVYETAAGRVGVAICYDRHYPEYMRALGVAGAELVVIPQAGAVGEWPDGLFEAEVRTAAFQNGYWAALCNRVGEEERLTFAGESFVVDPEGQVTARAARGAEELLVADVDLEAAARSTARKYFWRDRRPELYGGWIG